jgi:hypothetical protein
MYVPVKLQIANTSAGAAYGMRISISLLLLLVIVQAVGNIAYY